MHPFLFKINQPHYINMSGCWISKIVQIEKILSMDTFWRQVRTNYIICQIHPFCAAFKTAASSWNAKLLFSACIVVALTYSLDALSHCVIICVQWICTHTHTCCESPERVISPILLDCPGARERRFAPHRCVRAVKKQPQRLFSWVDDDAGGSNLWYASARGTCSSSSTGCALIKT